GAHGWRGGLLIVSGNQRFLLEHEFVLLLQFEFGFRRLRQLLRNFCRRLFLGLGSGDVGGGFLQRNRRSRRSGHSVGRSRGRYFGDMKFFDVRRRCWVGRGGGGGGPRAGGVLLQ